MSDLKSQLSDEEQAQLFKIQKPVLMDKDDSFWEWDDVVNKWFILGNEGLRLKHAPGSTRENIDRLYGPTKLVDEIQPLRTQTAALHKALRDGYFID